MTDPDGDDGYATSLREFRYLVDVMSRHHAEQVAGWADLRIRRRSGTIRFVDAEGRDVPLEEVHDDLQRNEQTKRWVYNLWMSHAR